MECSTKAVSFTVSRKITELITPAEPTPHEFKPLSDQDGLRLQIPAIMIYPSMQGKDPVNIIRAAIAKALVFYYPYAGRLREVAPTRKLLVECTAEGVPFVEAHADVTAQHFPLHPPFPNLDQLLCDVPGYDGVIDCPLIVFQVTRLKCGGVIVAFRFNHAMGDAAGAAQFLSAISELALGAEAPSIRPVWERRLLSARNPPCVSFAHPEYKLVPGETLLPLLENMVERPFFFSAADISSLRRSLPPKFRSCSQFDLVAASVWRCRTMALSENPHEEVRLLCAVSIRDKLKPTLPEGYYGNSVVIPMAVATAGELCNNPLHYITELVRKTKAQVTEKYVRSAVDAIVMKGRTNFNIDGNFLVSDLGRYGRVDELDFGWGKAAYGGIAIGCHHSKQGTCSWLVHCKNEKGENGISVCICLPANAMEVFTKELKMLMEVARKTTISSASAL